MTPMHLPARQYQQQLEQKVQRLQTLLSPFQPPAPQVFPSASEHYRMRMEFRLWHQGDDLYHIMFHPDTHQRIRIDQISAASQQINILMSAIMQPLRRCPVLRNKLFQIDYLTTTSQQALISLLYHRQPDDEWRQQALALRDNLRQQYPQLHLIGRASKCKIMLDQDYVDEQLTIAGQPIIYRQVENCFTQPNAAINTLMLEWALNVTHNIDGDLLELYCGNGNFSLALARQFRRVLATEICKASVQAAQYNIMVNQIHNVQILRMSAEEFTLAINGVRSFNRLKGINLPDYQCQTVLVDPPRAGLDQQTLHMIQHFRQILYFSCNPETLYQNLLTLTQTHHIARLALFDQFPYTKHIECGLWLIAR